MVSGLGLNTLPKEPPACAIFHTPPTSAGGKGTGKCQGQGHWGLWRHAYPGQYSSGLLLLCFLNHLLGWKVNEACLPRIYLLHLGPACFMSQRKMVWEPLWFFSFLFYFSPFLFPTSFFSGLRQRHYLVRICNHFMTHFVQWVLLGVCCSQCWP